MTVNDGSFSLERGMKRFLDRWPKKQFPCLHNLLIKGGNMTEKEVLSAVGQLVLHPNYTIPLLGCFRPIAEMIMERAVGLLHAVPNLRSDDDDGHMEDLNEEEGGISQYNIIDVYVRMGKGLRLHELACLAFCRALDLIPLLLGSIIKYFKFAPAPFERIVQCESVTKILATGSNQLLNVALASYRFLYLRPDIFTTLWDLSPFLYLVQQTTLGNDEAMFDLRWCSIAIIKMAPGLSVEASANPEDFNSFLRWEEFRMDVSMEKGSWYLECPDRDTEAKYGRKINLKGGLGLKPCSSITVETVPSNKIGMQDKGSPETHFVLKTSALTKCVEMVKLAVSQRWPVLLYGPAGCGKTALIYELARDCGNRVLSIHMDEQIDGKTLVGTYVCTEQPGEFRWQAGSLTQAVLNGFWVVFEDVDKAPADILSILLPLLEGGVAFSTGHGQAVRVNKSFRLFSTMTSSNPDTSCFAEGKNSLGAVWRKIMIAPPGNQDLRDIVLRRYPKLEHHAEKLIETFERMNKLIRFQLGIASASSYYDRFTLRDLLKFCERVKKFCSGEAWLNPDARDNIYIEAIDVFASFSTSAGNRLAIMREIARLWDAAGTETLYPVNKPVIQESKSEFRIGRACLRHAEMDLNRDRKPFVALRASIHTLERIARSVEFNEPVLLVGETGTGKTTLVQTLATRLGQKLTVLNLSQQSDVADMLGGFKPLDARFVCIPLYQEFEDLFSRTFSSKDNDVYLSHLRKFLSDKNWKMLLSGFQKGIRKIVEIGESSSGKKRKRPLSEKLVKAWELFSMKLERAHAQVNASDGMVFSFVEGAFVTALKKGEWILLDEINLAPPEILQRVIGVLENESGSLCLAERGDIEYVARHSNFRLFACMNPATDAGKRNLPNCLRSRFTEYFVDDVLDEDDLVLFINQFIDDDPSSRSLVTKIMEFYRSAKKYEVRLQDGANQKPNYSLRSLYRALEYLKKAQKDFKLENSIYDGFSMFFLNSLDVPSAKFMDNLISMHLLKSPSPKLLPFESYLMMVTEADNKMVTEADNILESYILTDSIKKQLNNLARAIFVGKYPVLLQGPTSSGKTSLVRYLAARTDHVFVRINNHEHTDLQEYLGSYITDACGKLVFHEGVLVKAVRKGHWIVLDELNLAPSDVLEALNRLLDDNRELFVPELQETIHAHPEFMLFATQNPPAVYAGRKILSRAFRNRFVEIHVDEIPREELSTILAKRCNISESNANKMVKVMKELQSHRKSSEVFAGKHGYITLRDLFRWADRFRKFGISNEDLAYDGYYLLAERLRDDAEKRVVVEVLERELRIKFFNDVLYKESKGADCSLKANNYSIDARSVGKIILTKTLRRMYFLVERCYEMREPVLLVGETGGGKTTVCQLLSFLLGKNLHVLNCHQYTETSDFLGGFYPIRERSKISRDFQNLCEEFAKSKAFINFTEDKKFSLDINQASQTLYVFSLIIKSYRECSVSHPEVTVNELGDLENIYQEMCQLQKNWRTIFTWQDGPLVQAMRRGDMFLVDEISLADDSVLERLNSVLEPEKILSLVEKGGSDLENIKAHPNFFILATMNPGGDYGKKELSPALRNRFTEIWVPSVTDIDELKSIALERILEPKLSDIVDVMLDFWEWFNFLQTGRILTVRDLLSWVSFINVMSRHLPAESAFVHGAFLILLDGLNLGTNISKIEAAELRVKCLSCLVEKLKEKKLFFDPCVGLESYGWADPKSSAALSCDDNMECDNLFGIHPFYIEKGTNCVDTEGFKFLAPTTRRNKLRVLRAMQLNKPVLLEGSPGVGKTSLVAAIGRFSGHKVVRINLSEQTDIMDLLGSDLPVESDEGMQFAWSDGILLQALKDGSWVLLDELNLAPQSVLEGLNAILDHRAEVFIPELGRSFKCPTSFRVFACQNPSYQGGGRKGLPKSFLNRFTKVYVDELVDEDYRSICSSLYPSIEESLLLKLVVFNRRLYEDTMVYKKFGQDGSPWEFNLRDVIRSCEIIKDASEKLKPNCFLSSIYLQRMRTSADRLEVMKLYEQTFGVKPFINLQPKVRLNPDSLIVGGVSMERYRYQSSRTSNDNLKVLPGLCHCLEAVAQCVKHQWLCILVGHPSSGKTSLIRLLADLTGNVLNELNLSSATDTSEILGSFEQYNTSRHFGLVVDKVDRYLNEYFNLQLESSSEALIQRKSLSARWFAFLSKINHSTTFMDNPRMRDFMMQLVEIIGYLKLHIDKQSLPLSYSLSDLDSTLSMTRKLEDYQRSQNSVKFEWVSGLLIKAIENGEWIVLENANLCNPTVLDRINSLVEQSGSITINECGTVDGKPVVLHPHPKFRMFLTVNPSFGEVSRAMRNRGVEIYLMQPSWPPDQIRGMKLHEMELREVKRFIVLAGIPGGRLVDMMSNAHMFAKHEGLRLDVSITYLELSRWVQLFQHLVTDGNQPSWSIQISWEHIYLSSLGEGKGKDIVSQAATSYLSMSQLYKFTSPEDRLLCLPGGWPVPLKLSDYISHSKEACITENIMYLGSLGSQTSSYFFNDDLKRSTEGNTSLAGGSKMIRMMDAISLHGLMYPEETKGIIANSGAQFDLELALEKLFFAAVWVMEQATESDYSLYIRWFEWFDSQVHPKFSFFKNISDLLKEVQQHAIWKKILELRRELISERLLDKVSTYYPILSAELVDVCPSVGVSHHRCIHLRNLIQCVTLLRKSLKQWSKEDKSNHGLRTQFLTFFAVLQQMEDKLLNLLVESSFFDVIFKSYSDLLEHHILFWNSIISSKFEHEQIFLRLLMKDAVKMQTICPDEASLFQQVLKDIAVKRFDGISFWDLNSSRSLLWAHGGHPLLPSSANMHKNQSELLNLCETNWPRQSKFIEFIKLVSAPDNGNEYSEIAIHGVLFSDVELRKLALEGICMSSLIIGEADDNNSKIIQRLEEMYQMLVERLDFEKQKWIGKLETTRLAPTICSTCCVCTPDVLCNTSGLEFWIRTQPIVDETSLCLDLELLQQLTKITVVDIDEQHKALSEVSDLLKASKTFSLNYSARPLLDFSPHQNILWTLDAWGSVQGANKKISSFTLDMWFRWHTTLWEACLVEALPGDEDYNALLPQKFFWPLKLKMVDHILNNASPVRDYQLHGFKLRAASRSIWQSSENMVSVKGMIPSAARSLFQQIIFAYKKSFEHSSFVEIRAAFHSLQEQREPLQNVDALVPDRHVFTSLIGSYIRPLLSELYDVFPSDDLQNIGCALLRIGGLRYNLLVCCDDLDPTLKYSIKYAELTKKIALLEIEIQVREECIYLAGSNHQREDDSYRIDLLEKLHAEKKRLHTKMVFRPDPAKFKDLKRGCKEFLEVVKTIVEWENWGTEEVIKQVHNWQEITSCFIEQLSKEYPDYVDITEPVQVALYEMKLGLSLIVSGVLHKRYLPNGEQNMENSLSTICKFVRFPRAFASKNVSVNVGKELKLYSRHIELPTSIEEVDVNVLLNIAEFTENFVSTRESAPHAMASTLPFKVSVYHNILARIRDSVADSRFFGVSSFKLLCDIFQEIACLWVKHRAKLTEELQFKFRARAFKMESITDIDVSSFAKLLGNESFSEWQELLSEELDEKMKVNEEGEALEQGWNAQESDLDGIVSIHNQLFGSVDLVRRPGDIQVSDADRLSSFLNSYTLGVKTTRDWKGLFPSRFDSEISPEHLFRLCLEHDDKFIPSRKSTSYNFYKDLNSPKLTEVVEPVTLLKQQIICLLKEWDDHTAHHLALRKFLEVCDMILSLPLDTPIGKALSALEFLINRIQNEQNTGSKFPLSDRLEPIFALVSSWHKLEVESWPALLDEIQSQFEKNAGKLWFPLYSVFFQGQNEDHDGYEISMIESLDVFFKTSTIGEFKKQLQLLIAFYGQIKNNSNLSSDSSPFQEVNAKILYNTFGFYVQFLPRILEHTGESRSSIEKELHEILKLCRWDQNEKYLALEKFKSTRLKLRKILKKYTDLLQQPLMGFLGRETPRGGINTSSVHGQKLMLDPYEVIKTLLDNICNRIESKAKRAGEITGGIKGIPSHSSCSYWEEKNQLWHTIETLCVNMIHCGKLWEDKTKKLGKRRAFSDLLKLLDSCGLSKYRTFMEVDDGKSNSWLLQPSYEVQHLLPSQNDDFPKIANVDLSHLHSSSNGITWKTANKFYFKSIASIKLNLMKICLNFHKDFSKIQVERSGSYVDHLLEIQQEQRAGAYNFASKLKCLRQCVWPLANFFSRDSLKEPISESYLSLNQHSTFNCMWQQKQLFDGFCTLLYEEHLLFQTIDNNHLNTCSVVKDEVKKIRLFFHTVLPDFQKSKDMLDHHLLGSYEGISLAGVALHPYGVTKEMEEVVNQNFELIKTFEKDLSAFHGQGALEHILIGHYKVLFAKAHDAEESYSSAQEKKYVSGERSIKELESDFGDALKETNKHISSILQSIGSENCDSALNEESLKNIKGWKTLFDKDAERLQLDLICQDVLRTIQCAGELLNYRGERNISIGSVFEQLRELKNLLDMILAFGDNLMQDFLVLHSMVSEMTYALANIFASLFLQGFGTTEDQENDSMKEATQDVSGTGMGEGAGLNDVSDQIEDEDQLLGTSEKANEERDDASEMPSKTEKGIEMEEDFNAEAFDVSEDSEDDENEGDEDEQIESAMGEVGANSDVVDEKVGDINDDNGEEDQSANEKYEQGPSVKDKASKDDELRAKEDSTASKEDANNDDLDEKESNEGNDECGNDGEEDMKVDKNDAYLDSSGINPDVQEQETDMDELDGTEAMEDGESADLDDSDLKNDEEKADEFQQEAGSEHSADNNEAANDEESLTETDVQMPKQDPMQSAPNDNTVQSLGQTVEDFSATADMGDSAPDQKYSNFGEFKNELAPTNGQPNALNLEVRVSDSMDGKSLTNEQSRTSLPRSDSLIQKPQPNPYRSIGEAVDGWKERIKVSVDMKEQIENSNDMVDDADEYGFTAEFEKGTAQALGPATADQLKGDITRNANEMDVENDDTTDPTADIEVEKRTSETNPIDFTAVKDVNNQQGVLDVEQLPFEPMDVDYKYNQDMSGFPESVVSVKRSYMSEEMHQIDSSLMSDDNHLGKANVFELSADIDDASALWRDYETLTTRLSQELAEQLRLIMEPTSASKLQGDYKTGKRINMKKVIPYVASQYRKDKIWLRRTRPNKRDYQVVIAVDDSLSMSEGKCGDFAKEALVTVCRAMSHVEVGNLAVASFGQQGNIRLLHDFDHPFTPEAGIKMISSLTFKQENYLLDEPVVDLLKYVNNTLDDAVKRSRLPSGYNPLQQLVLIISDGRFNEKEKLRRRVRDISSTKRMVAFLILDSPNESILDFQEATFASEYKFSKYLDSFPFPYYAVLKNIEALPRTVADLLKQWFELMQNSRE